MIINVSTIIYFTSYLDILRWVHEFQIPCIKKYQAIWVVTDFIMEKKKILQKMSTYFYCEN